RSGLVLPGRSTARLQARFDISALPSVQSRLSNSGLQNEDDPDTLLISRSFKTEGSDKVLINGIMTTASALRDLGGFLMEIHGQNEHQTLLLPEVQRHLLDRMGGEPHQKLLNTLAATYSEHERLHTEVEALEQRLASGEARLDHLTATLQDLESLQIVSPDEEQQLIDESHRLAHAEQLSETISSALQALEGGDEDDGAIRLLHRARDASQQAGLIDQRLLPFSERLEALYYEAADIASGFRHEADVEYDPKRLSLVQARLSAFQQACRRHRTDFAGLFALIEGMKREIAELTAPDTSRGKLRKALGEAEARLSAAAA
ncbi:MAG TPA: hypothetical protein PKM25_10220, partial [Candidatus Ozemobacteraceae bacterium]|nr:hypothetical protein [Candidatus Ozemobacteraceae bacterium]